jgi:MoaA/NifB/PqqE/SkfB family radical SAM enzyme
MKKRITESQEPVQHGLRRVITGKLQTLWIEFPGYCNLACSYCYACGGEKLRKEDLLPYETYHNLLVQAKFMGVDSIGIPGAGEPFHPLNKENVVRFLYECQEKGFFVTLFSTGEFITPELATELYGLPVEIMLKGNSLRPEQQDRFVSDPEKGRNVEGYGLKRNRAIEILMKTGFNNKVECFERFCRTSRIALVTSIMTTEAGELSNLEEIAEILRFCRRNNIIFDCDTVLRQGRGASCHLCTADQELRQKLLELRDIDATEFDNHWEIGPGYVGTTCDRYGHHMYISQYGDIRPCIGAPNVVLGNVRDTTLAEAWSRREMKIIRNRQYGGKCAECTEFAKGNCHSCLGRHTTNLNNQSLLETGQVETIGCWNFQQKK